MDPNQSARPVYDDQPEERPMPARPVEPAPPMEYRREVVETEGASPAARVGQVIYVILGIIIALIVIRVILKALAANPGAGFTGFVYGITAPLVAPFQGIFNTPQTGNGSVFEFSSVVAIVVYALIAWAIVSLIGIAGRRRTTTTA